MDLESAAVSNDGSSNVSVCRKVKWRSKRWCVNTNGMNIQLNWEGFQAYRRKTPSSLPPGFHRQRRFWRAVLASRWPPAWARWAYFWSWLTWTGTWHRENQWVSMLLMSLETLCLCVCARALARLAVSANASRAEPTTKVWFMSIWFSLGLRLPTPAEQVLSRLFLVHSCTTTYNNSSFLNSFPLTYLVLKTSSRSKRFVFPMQQKVRSL